MNYEKKYKEAFERARKLYEQGTITESLAYIFPELKESEDERIRKALLRFHKSTIDIDGIKGGDILAWLEKQGKNNMGISEATKKKLEDNLNKALEKETPKSWNKFLDEQKPAWSEEDENHVKSILSTIECCKAQFPNAQAVVEAYNADIEFLKSLKDRVFPQPKQEWNEEDERQCNNILNVLIDYKELESEYYWLKSLRPQSPWKPSEGQLECLGYAIEKAEKDWSTLTNNRIYLTLKALKEQLEKL